MATEKNKPTVLIAEDEEINRSILREILKNKYRILEAENGHQAVFTIKEEEANIALIILDIHMPKLDGFGVMDYLQETGLNEKIPVIITTSDESADILVQGKKNKVVDIIYKPFRAADLLKSVDAFVQISALEQNLEDIINEKSVYLTNQYEAVKKAKNLHRGKWDDNIRAILKKMLPGNEEHNVRIQKITALLCERLMNKFPKYGLSKSVNKVIVDATLLHDLGKVVIPDSVFTNNDASSSRAMVQVKKRPIAGSEMINIMFANTGHQMERKYGYDICRYMFENYDGKGYPVGLTGKEIPICAQIVGLAHRYEELRFLSDGSEKPHKSVMRKILEAEYKAYNPDLMEAFEDIDPLIEEAFEKKNN